MKKLISIILTTLLILSLYSCSESAMPSSENGVTLENTPIVSATPKPTSHPTPTPSPTPKPTVTPTPEPTPEPDVLSGEEVFISTLKKYQKDTKYALSTEGEDGAGEDNVRTYAVAYRETVTQIPVVLRLTMNDTGKIEIIDLYGLTSDVAEEHFPAMVDIIADIIHLICPELTVPEAILIVTDSLEEPEPFGETYSCKVAVDIFTSVSISTTGEFRF